MPSSDDIARRSYWTEQLELGYKLVEELLEFPVEECGESFASLPELAAAAGVEMQFSSSKIAGDLDRIFSMRESNAADVIKIGATMNQRGWILKIEEGFRSLEMQGMLVRKPSVFDVVLEKCIWENGGEIPSVEFVARRAIVMVANIPKIGGHMSGSAIDISVFHRNDGSEVSRGGPYLMINEKTPMRSPYITAEELENRLEITEMMAAEGFIHFPYEFWHYSKDDVIAHIVEKRTDPARFGPVNWDADTNQITPVAEPLIPLNPLPMIEKEIAAAIKRSESRT